MVGAHQNDPIIDYYYGLWDAMISNEQLLKEANAGARTPSTSLVSDGEDSDSASQGSCTGSRALVGSGPSRQKPRFINSFEVSNLDWRSLNAGQERRRELLLRGLPRQLCEERGLREFLEAKGFGEAVQSLKICPAGKTARGKVGSAVVKASSAAAAQKLAKFFHGRQLLGSSLPVAVSFAGSEERRKPSGVAEPMKVKCTLAGMPDSLPPGLAGFLPLHIGSL